MLTIFRSVFFLFCFLLLGSGAVHLLLYHIGSDSTERGAVYTSMRSLFFQYLIFFCHNWNRVIGHYSIMIHKVGTAGRKELQLSRLEYELPTFGNASSPCAHRNVCVQPKNGGRHAALAESRTFERHALWLLYSRRRLSPHALVWRTNVEC